ncbi:MAG: prepilin peptidase [Cellulomonadaceae bacterium]|jgi:leader peptidase (prepilin peptidase)/N-methyltransferase|nr:prepilin peptidase [Cellulomonadaceae bacterium]
MTTQTRVPILVHSLLAPLRREIAPYARQVLVIVPACVVFAILTAPDSPLLVRVAVGVTAAAGATAAVIDWHTFRLPDAVVVPGMVLTMAALALAQLIRLAGLAEPALLEPESSGRFLPALLGAAALGSGWALLWVLGRGHLGFGDVKLAVLLGLTSGWFDWSTVWWTGALPLLFAGTFALMLLATRRAERTTPFPLGPWMLLGWLSALVATGTV